MVREHPLDQNIQTFLQACTVSATFAPLRTSDLYQGWVQWLNVTGAIGDRPSLMAFASALSRLGYKRTYSRKGSCIIGVMWKQPP